ncbi:hypothetical protein PM082_012582 [Marasmius tenuissimus]|nr:hypothetical protein PM082_012582 [Marasmius tenuissimus]
MLRDSTTISYSTTPTYNIPAIIGGLSSTTAGEDSETLGEPHLPLGTTRMDSVTSPKKFFGTIGDGR